MNKDAVLNMREVFRCPLCQGKYVGRISKNGMYFCINCDVEVSCKLFTLIERRKSLLTERR